MIRSIAKLFGVSPRVATWGVAVLGVVLVLAAFYMTLDAYGDARFKAGEAQADKAWQDASNKLVTKSLAAGKEADTNAAARALEYSGDLAKEKEKIDEALDHGSSPFDVMFPVSNGM